MNLSLSLCALSGIRAAAFAGKGPAYLMVELVTVMGVTSWFEICG